jgi:hypothetical protein
MPAVRPRFHLAPCSKFRSHLSRLRGQCLRRGNCEGQRICATSMSAHSPASHRMTHDVAIVHDVVSGTDIRLTMSASNGRGLFLERSEIDKKDSVRQNSARDAQSENIKRAPFERILLSDVAEGCARLSVRQSGRFDSMTLRHSRAPYVLSHLDCVLVLVIPICSRDLDAKYAMEQFKPYAGWWPNCTSRSARSGRP